MISSDNKSALKFASEAAIAWRDDVTNQQIEAYDSYEEALARFGGAFPQTGLPPRADFDLPESRGIPLGTRI